MFLKQFFAFILALSLIVPQVQSRELLDRVVAVVNDEPITQSEIDIVLRPLYENFSQQYEGRQLMEQLNTARRKLLNQLIEDRLVYQEAKRQEIEVSETELDEMITNFKARFKSPEEMEQALLEQGVTLKDIRDRYRRQRMVQRLQEREIRGRVMVSPGDVEEYYKSHPEQFTHKEKLKVRSITVKKGDQAREKGMKDEAALKKINGAREKILAGESFSSVAALVSEDMNAQDGGLSDWIERGTMIPEIDGVIFSMKVGELSEIIETPMGYHLFLVDEKDQGHKLTLEQAREEIYSKVYAEKGEARFTEWMQELKRDAYISIK